MNVCFGQSVKKMRGCKYGGVDEKGCNVYGTNGTLEAPSRSKVMLEKRRRTWSIKAQSRDCAWVCCGKAIDCGGLRKGLCSKYGTTGTHVHLIPPAAKLERMRLKKGRERKKQKRAQSKKK